MITNPILIFSIANKQISGYFFQPPTTNFIIGTPILNDKNEEIGTVINILKNKNLVEIKFFEHLEMTMFKMFKKFPKTMDLEFLKSFKFTEVC